MFPSSRAWRGRSSDSLVDSTPILSPDLCRANDDPSLEQRQLPLLCGLDPCCLPTDTSLYSLVVKSLCVKYHSCEVCVLTIWERLLSFSQPSPSGSSTAVHHCSQKCPATQTHCVFAVLYLDLCVTPHAQQHCNQEHGSHRAARYLVKYYNEISYAQARRSRCHVSRQHLP